MKTLLPLFVAMMMVMLSMPLTAQAGKSYQECGGSDAFCGQVTVKNENCTKLVWFKTKKRVKVQVYNPSDVMCNQWESSWHHIPQGHSVTIPLVGWIDGPAGTRPYYCTYAHEAEGTTGGKEDVHGNEVSSVTCKKDWAGVCQCTKD